MLQEGFPVIVEPAQLAGRWMSGPPPRPSRLRTRPTILPPLILPRLLPSDLPTAPRWDVKRATFLSPKLTQRIEPNRRVPRAPGAPFAQALTANAQGE